MNGFKFSVNNLLTYTAYAIYTCIHAHQHFKRKKMKIYAFANTVDPDEVAHNEPPHLDLHCLPVFFKFSVLYCLDEYIFLKFCRYQFCQLFPFFLACLDEAQEELLYYLRRRRWRRRHRG